MPTTEHYSQLIEDYISSVNYPENPRKLYDPIRYSLEEGGKRLRPMFVLLACGLFRDDVSGSLPAAACIEMFHNFTLMHDDIMDNAPLRRGRPSVCNKWDANVAILSGDSLMVYSCLELAKTRPELLSEIFRYFGEAAVKVCEGQQYDMDFEGRDDVKLPEHIAMIELKTSALFVGAVSMGAVVGGASSEDIGHLRDFALEFGIAFQMQDDLLDSYGDARLGKTVGGDILEGKKTFLKMNAMAAANADDRMELEMIHKDIRYTPEEKIRRVLQIYGRYGVKEATEKEIAARFSVAAAALGKLSVPAEKVAALKDFALGLLGRTK